MHRALLMAGIAAVCLAGIGPAAAATTSQPVPAQPRVTGTMYNGNNTQPGSLKLQEPLAPITEALERLETAAPARNEQTVQPNAQLGGASTNARAGGGG